jgi:hypothetical protein
LKEIKLSNSSKVAIVDDEDFEKFGHLSFNLSQNGYPRVNIKGKTYCLHNLIMNNPPPGLTPDHRDRDKLNNQRNNLTYNTGEGQKKNRNILKNNTSGYTNICYNIHAQKYAVRIRINGKRKHVGYFSTIEEARIALANAK